VYLHVPVHPDYQRYLRLYFEGRAYQVVSSTSSTSPALQMETTPGPSGSGNSPSRILVKGSLEILGVRDSSQSGGVVTSTPPKLSMFTDASNFSWGAHVNKVDLSTNGTWSPEESKMSINILELKAVLLGVKHFRTQLKNQRLSLFSDNSMVVAYIRKQGGTQLPSSLQNDMGASPVLPSREHSPHPTAYTG
jgi:hypothetical protein